jgi:DNA replication protein DnaC
LDEWLLYPLYNSDTAEMLELFERRQQHTSTIICSQVDSCDWVPRLGSEVIVAEAVCNRFVHDAYRIVVQGDSTRKLNGLAAKEA